MADESAAQRVGIGKAAAHRHLLRRLAPELQETPRCRNARLFDQAAGVMPTSSWNSRAK
jgi:hypothetical protein